MPVFQKWEVRSPRSQLLKRPLLDEEVFTGGSGQEKAGLGKSSLAGAALACVRFLTEIRK